MQPDNLSLILRRLASDIDLGHVRSRTSVAAILAKIIEATDQSVARAVRDALLGKIQELLPAQFDGFFDTKEEGKGFAGGYISFGLKPAGWDAEGILGGILVYGSYDQDEFRSEVPKEGPGEGFKHSKGGGVFDVQLNACYTLKKRDMGCDKNYDSVSLGLCTVQLNAQEEVEELQIVDPGTLKAGIQGIIDEIQASPPDYGQSAERKRKYVAPTGSAEGLHNWLLQQGRSDVKQSEILALARAVNKRTGKAVGNAVEDITNFFRKKHFPIDPNG